MAIELPRRTVGRNLEIRNHSDVPVPYQIFGVEPNGIFHVSPVSGVLQPHLPGVVSLSFSPDEPGNYYKRLVVLVRNQAPRVLLQSYKVTSYKVTSYRLNRVREHLVPSR